MTAESRVSRRDAHVAEPNRSLGIQQQHRTRAAATDPHCRSHPMSRVAPHRLRAAAVRRRLLPLLPVSLHQRPDRRRSHRRARSQRRRPRPADVGRISWSSPRSSSPAASCSTATGRASSRARCCSSPAPGRSCCPRRRRLGLMLGRALIGLGVAVALMAASRPSCCGSRPSVSRSPTAGWSCWARSAP